jgi:peptide/nickel transport system substrate-binding protein
MGIRQGVQWSDGKPFSSKDVAFTFDMLRKNPALNIANINTTTATAPDPKTVVLTFAQPAYAQTVKVGGITPVPAHVYTGKNPVTFADPNPVGTGPYTLDTFATQVYTLKANPKYWQKDKIKVKRIQYPAVSSNSFTSLLGQGRLDWSGGFVAHVDQIFVNKDKAHNKYWYPADGLVNLVSNLKRAPLDNLAVRKAVSGAIDRAQLSKVAALGYEDPASPTGLVRPAYDSFLDPQYKDLQFKTDPTAANAALDQAGFHKGADGIRVGPDGKRLAFSILVPSGFSDWVTMARLIQSQLKAIGIEIDPQGKSTQAWKAALKTGNYDMAIAGSVGGSTPYDLYRPFLSSKLTAPVGQQALSNYARWSDPATDTFLGAFEHTDNPAQLKAAVYGLEKVMVEQLPVIPLLGSANWSQTRTTKFTGWPSQSDPYALPAPYQYPDNLLVITHLKPA